MTQSSSWKTADVLETVRRYWGFGELRPMQEEGIRAGLENRDSLVVMPTGGGKSLCYQVPPALTQRTDIVVSPLISLMKDEVDGLRDAGYPAAALHSGMSLDELRQTEREIFAGHYHLLFMAPERLLSPRGLQLVERLQVRAFAVDEAHCISHWGHDFRPEYRQLAELKQRFPTASVHAYTATATARVRDDIVAQLHLENPAVLVGTFDRSNLVYRVVPRIDLERQVIAVLGRHAEQAAIVYCLSRRDAEEMAATLAAEGLRCAPYHAGMDPEARRQTQERFADEELDVVSATVAFGMGIDRSDVRCVVHATMPKSIEHYQQETGRAGRDGLPAECVLFYSAADVLRWEALLAKSAEEAGGAIESQAAARELLDHMRRYCGQTTCRHRALSEYFGQPYPAPQCGACDACLDEVEGLADATETAQKVLSCVARAGQHFGITHIVDVLLGGQTDAIRRWQHDRLSTYGLMKGVSRKELTNIVYQLIDEGVLDRSADSRPVLSLNEASWAVMRGQRTICLRQAATPEVKETVAEVDAWAGVDRGLFDSLRALRREIATERKVPAYVVFSDVTLRDMARLRPSSATTLLDVHGIGERKLADLGERFLAHLRAYCDEHGLALDVPSEGRASRKTRGPKRPSPSPKTFFLR